MIIYPYSTPHGKQPAQGYPSSGWEKSSSRGAYMLFKSVALFLEVILPILDGFLYLL